jgi:hypothetical protein
MSSSRSLWTLAIVLTLVFSVWQRVSGPTYPIYGTAALGPTTMKYKLERTHAGPGDHTVRLKTGVVGETGVLEWREHSAGAAWTPIEMSSPADQPAFISADLPHHGPGQKVDYRVTLRTDDATVVLPPKGVATLRFRNDVPWWVLIPHIICMMGALLMSTRAALEALAAGPKLKEFTLRTLSALFIGGFPLGLLVSGYAFGQPWGGFPIGSDATDNKTLVAFIAWVVAAVFVFRSRSPRGWVVAAAVVMTLVYMIPHSFSLPG